MNFRSTYKRLVVGSRWLHTRGFGSHMHTCTQHARHIHICTLHMHTCTHMHTHAHTHTYTQQYTPYIHMHAYIFLRNLRDCTVHSQNPETACQSQLWLCNLKLDCTLRLRNLKLDCALWLCDVCCLHKQQQTSHCPAGPVLARPLFWHPSPMTRKHHEGSFVYQSEIATARMWCTKSSLSANLHVLSMSRVRRSRKLQSSGSEAQRCYEDPSRQLKNKGEKNFPHFAQFWLALHTSMHCLRQWPYHSKRLHATPG